jgi:tetratricopeptide (TPR) repeat protein
VTLLARPRSVPPSELPVPLADPRALGQAMETDDARARAAEVGVLDPDVRALGTLVRAFGRADARGDDDALAAVRAQVGPAAARARAQGEEPVLALRAYQLRSFVAEARRWARTGEASSELVELGGPFAELVRRNGWCEGEGPCALAMDEAALRASWKRRWNEITGLRGGGFELGLDETRALYRFLLEHPAGGREAADGARTEGAKASFLLRKIDELAALDATYPRLFARGVVLYRQGEYRRAAEAFGAHLDASPDGPWVLRAQNHLHAALEQGAAEPF